MMFAISVVAFIQAYPMKQPAQMMATAVPMIFVGRHDVYIYVMKNVNGPGMFYGLSGML